MVAEPIPIPEDGLRLRPSPRKWLVVLAIAATFTAVGTMMVGDGASGGWFVTIFFGLCTAIGLVVLLPGSMFLEVRRDGFETSHLFRRRRFAWSEVGRFSAVEVVSRPMVAFDRIGAAPSRLGKLSAAIAGANDALPDTYGMDAAELAALMNAARERALARG